MTPSAGVMAMTSHNSVVKTRKISVSALSAIREKNCSGAVFTVPHLRLAMSAACFTKPSYFTFKRKL